MNNRRIVSISVAAICLTLVCAFLFAGRVEASPAAPIEFTLTQPDGSTFTASQWGDEWNNGIETIEGYSILQMEDGLWVYAEPKADGLLGPAMSGGSYLVVGIDSPEGLTLHLRPTLMRENPNSLEAKGLTSPDLKSPQAPSLTNVKTLLLLADFNNIVPLYSAASFQSLMFSTTSSSVRKFYREASFNNMDIVPAEETCGTANDGTTNWTELAYAHPNTGASTGLANQQLVKDVLVANDGCINFAAFDTNANGYIDSSELQIIVVVAGYERAYNTSTPSIWAHQWSLDDVGAPTLDGKVVGDYPYGGYAQYGERHGTHQATFGIMAHEFGHAINWPDLYDTDDSSEGVGNWSVMGSGSWNSTSIDGDSPAYADAWLKWYQGWITPTTITGTNNNVSIPRAEDHPTAFLLRPNANGVDWLFDSYSGTGEFFLVENRQYTGYDAGLDGCGLLIWHIDESVIYDNTANADETHALVWLEQADGLNELASTGDRGDTGDPYPGSTSNYNFNSGTNPNSNLYSGSASSASVHVDSSACAPTMLADLTYVTGAAPGDFNKTTPANGAGGQSFSGLTLDWADAASGTSYEYCYDATLDEYCTGTWTSTGATSQASVSGLGYAKTYEWHVRSNNTGGSTYSNLGDLWTFTTASVAYSDYNFLPLITFPGPPPAPFGKSNPSNGETGVSINPLINWAGSAGATSYDFCYDLTVNGDCTGGWTSTGSASQISLTGLPYSTTYEWQARARNATGTIVYADGGTEWSFTTGAAWTTLTTETFETAIPKTKWQIFDFSDIDGGDYKTGRRTCNVHNGSYSGWLVGGGAQGGGLACGASYVANNNSWFIYGPFSTSSATAGELTFDVYVNNESGYDAFWALANDELYGEYSGYYWTGSFPWANYTIDLSEPLCGDGDTSCLGLSNVYIALSFSSDESNQYAYGAIVDDIVVRVCNAGACAPSAPPLQISPLQLDGLQDFLQPFLKPLMQPLFKQSIGFGSLEFPE
jgi:M6 family metalloprotease-like protein